MRKYTYKEIMRRAKPWPTKKAGPPYLFLNPYGEFLSIELKENVIPTLVPLWAWFRYYWRKIPVRASLVILSVFAIKSLTHRTHPTSLTHS